MMSNEFFAERHEDVDRTKYVDRSCVYCKHVYVSVDDLIERRPVAVDAGAATLACKACYAAQAHQAPVISSPFTP